MHNSAEVGLEPTGSGRHAEQRDLVPGLVRGPVQPLGLQHDEDGLHEVVHPLLHVGAVLEAGVEGHVGPLLLRDLALQPEHQQAGVVQRGAVHLLLAVEALGGLRPLLGRGAGGDADEAHHLAVRLEVAPLVVLRQVVVAVADVEQPLGVPDAHLAHAGDPLVDLEELVLRHDADRLHHHEDRLVVLGTLHDRYV
ncbi:hypothetical protein EYF80_022868 [Liparis tanakae]|uniref:Uncharacterized protein n=1 Tax=Liparis tanakae TaxID=230148 RepID=A0A4Z2HN38_9TELE|nr:hypothetical protein EYF80_022868 [Liparis tanakae]